jgi:hypothetical protein
VGDKRRLWRKATRALTWAGGVAFLFCALRCGEPLGPAPFGWENKATIPGDYSAFYPTALGPKGLYGIGVTQAGYRRLVTFDGSSFDVDYQTPTRDDFITGVSFVAGTGFMGVALRNYPEGHRATLLQVRDGEWAEILEIPEFEEFCILSAIDAKSCWLLSRRPNGRYEIAKYEDGRLNIIRPMVGHYFAGYSAKTNTFYAFTSEAGDMMISGDGGDSWCNEKMAVPPGYKLAEITYVSASPEGLYITANVIAADLKYGAIIKRTGPAGEGVYELSYLGWVGPGVMRIDECAFRDADHGMAVGLGASLYYDAPDWVREPVDPLSQIRDLTPDPLGGYWAIYEGAIVWHP